MNPAHALTRETGIGLRGPHFSAIFDSPPDIGWMEVHPENYFGGGRNRAALLRVRADYPVSLHAVGLSLGADQPVDTEHLRQIKELASLCAPFQISDHASWSASGNAHFNDLLPLPYTNESLQRLCDNIQRTQDYLSRTILLENPSSYVSFAHNDMDETHFMNEAARITGCGLLLDINNIYVQAHNHGYDAADYIRAIKPGTVGEMHLAGHTVREFLDGPLLVDTHNRAIAPAVWALFEQALSFHGPIPTLIEWDADLPTLKTLRMEADKAQNRINRYKAEARAHAA
ncbi:MAG: DUF692 domain-containing protein [Alphaproteobacteria bacterium]|nr:DUF692 domain-containing protein [Alphaproteobacteria bacterium]MBU0859022.1 DUF692 domain-containing protein [Alphaproteobacteria bacterium]